MSFGATDELLVRGVGAARDGNRDDARFYLEWALRDGPTTAQFVEAWYWLSRIADDPAERRRCLETALGAEPLHAEARRDLALLDGRLREADLLDPRATVPPLTPGGPVDDTAIRVYRCPACGGALTADPARGGLVCQFCGYRRGADGAAGATEQDWEAAIHTARGHRWVVPGDRTLSCQSCGAAQTIPASGASAVCAFCGSAQVVAEEAPGDLIAPTGLLPFALDGAAARERARAWLVERLGDDGERAALSPPRPIYLACWTFDIEGRIRWRGQVESTFGGRRAVEGDEHLSYDDLLVPGGAAVPRGLLDALRFDTATPAPYTPDVLAGWPAELYRVPPAAASILARERVADDYRERLRAAQGQRIDELVVESVGLAVVSYKLLLAPVWVTGYRHDGRDYRLLVNGQVGTVAGEAPRGFLGRLLAWIGDDEGGH
jgi:hypothetical protein